jgi:hypothetical protein
VQQEIQGSDSCGSVASVQVRNRERRARRRTRRKIGLASAVTDVALDEEEDRVRPDQVAVGGASLASKTSHLLVNPTIVVFA